MTKHDCPSGLGSKRSWGGLKWKRGEVRTNIISQENIRIVFARDRVDSMRTYDPCIVRFMRNALGLCHCRLPSPVADVIGSRGHALWSTLMIYNFQKISLGEVNGGEGWVGGVLNITFQFPPGSGTSRPSLSGLRVGHSEGGHLERTRLEKRKVTMVRVSFIFFNFRSVVSLGEVVDSILLGEVFVEENAQEGPRCPFYNGEFYNFSFFFLSNHFGFSPKSLIDVLFLSYTFILLRRRLRKILAFPFISHRKEASPTTSSNGNVLPSLHGFGFPKV